MASVKSVRSHGECATDARIVCGLYRRAARDQAVRAVLPTRLKPTRMRWRTQGGVRSALAPVATSLARMPPHALVAASSASALSQHQPILTRVRSHRGPNKPQRVAARPHRRVRVCRHDHTHRKHARNARTHTRLRPHATRPLPRRYDRYDQP